MFIFGFFYPPSKEQAFLGENINYITPSQQDNTLQNTGHVIFWAGILLFIVVSALLDKDRRKYVIISGIIGIFLSPIIFGLLMIFGNNFIGRLIFLWLFNSSQHIGEGGIILFYILPLYGFIAGSLLGFIIGSFKDKGRFYKKAGFYLTIVLLIIMFVSASQPIPSHITSSNKYDLVYQKAICEEVEGCDYLDEYKLCENSDREYPRINISMMPKEVLYTCNSFDINSKALTKDELIDGKCPNLINGEIVYTEPLVHPYYGGYYFKEGKIYVEGELCGEPGKIRYVARCSC